MPGTVVRLTGLKVYRSKGIEYVYHRASGIRLSPPHKPGSPEFMRAYADACSIKKPKVNQGRTLDAAIDRYLDSTDYLGLRGRTKADYQRIIKWLRIIGDTPLRLFTRAFVYKLRDKAYSAHKRRFANYVQSVLSVILECAVKAEWISDNPARMIKKVKRPTNAREANPAWTEAEYLAMLCAAAGYRFILVPFRHRGERPKAIEILFSDECRAVAKEIFQANRKATSAQIVENPCDE